MYMNKKVIKLANIDEVKEFVNAASSCEFDIDVQCNRAFVDAKSILGILCLGFQNKLVVCYGGENNRFNSVVDKFAVA